MADDLMQLYSTRILALTTQIPRLGRLDNPMGNHRARSPQCGSSVTVDVAVENGVVTDFAQDVKACALGQAAAAIVGAHSVGLTLRELQAARDALRRMLTENGPAPEHPFEEFEVLTAAIPFTNRHASILLSFDATIGAVNAALSKTS